MESKVVVEEKDEELLSQDHASLSQKSQRFAILDRGREKNREFRRIGGFFFSPADGCPI